MTRIAVTGHMDLADECIPLVRSEIDRSLSEYSERDLIGVSCIAKGADSVFAEAVLAKGGELEVVLPSRDYRQAKVSEAQAGQFDALLERARRVSVMPFDQANRTAYEAANEALLSGCDVLFAVWDGGGGKKGGTAGVVENAQARNLPIRIIWPDGARRSVQVN